MALTRGRAYDLAMPVRATLATLALLCACSATTVSGTLQIPAAIPLRTFPHIFVASGPQLAEIQLSQALVDHLRDGQRHVQRVERAELEHMRARGAIPLASVVVIVELDQRRINQTRFQTRPETVCGPAGCYTRNRTDAFDVPTLHGRLRVTVHEGPSARVLQRVSEAVSEEGYGWARMESRIVQRLLRTITRMVDARTERVAVQLLRVDVPEVERAIAEIGDGRWRRGRVRLERAARTDDVRELDDVVRARVLYNLGIARRFDPVTIRRDPQRHFRSAEASLQAAIRLDPDPLYDRALRELQAHRQQVSMLHEQREAAEHNYRLRDASTGSGNTDVLPTPPPGYGN